MLAGSFELAALGLDLLEQAGVLDRQDGLAGERLEQVDDGLGASPETLRRTTRTPTVRWSRIRGTATFERKPACSRALLSGVPTIGVTSRSGT